MVAVRRGMAERMAAGVVPGAQPYQQDLGIGFQEGTAFFHETGTMEFPVVFQVEDKRRIDLGIGPVDQLDLSAPRAGRKPFRAMGSADRARITIAVLGHQDARHPAFTFHRPEARQGAVQQVVAVARGDDHGDVFVHPPSLRACANLC